MRRQRKGPRVQKGDGFKDKLLDLARVTRVVAGGKRFRFRATVVVGDERGTVGVGVAKGLDVAQAIEKGRTDAKKKMITIDIKNGTIAHDVEAKFSAARVRLKPAVPGHGLKAGGAARVVLALAGVKDITSKKLGNTSNKLTNAIATLEALKKLQVKSVVKKVKPEVKAEVKAEEDNK
jgi:small subunit ribosomal protein S5